MTATRSGFTAGGGIEFGMTENLSARLEYDYLNFGTKTYTFAKLNRNPVPAGPAGRDPVQHEFDLGRHQLPLQLEWRWHNRHQVARTTLLQRAARAGQMPALVI